VGCYLNDWQARRIRTLNELCRTLRDCPAEAFEAHLERGDFSRWIFDVFGDYPLAARLREIEECRRRGEPLDARDRVLELVEQRYILADESSSPSLGVPDVPRPGQPPEPIPTHSS